MIADRKLVSDLWTMIEPVLAPDGIELVELEYGLFGGAWTLRLYIDTPTGVNIDVCAMVSRQVGALLDLENPIDHPYNLEVSSPGINRVLRKLQDFERFSDRKARIRTSRKIEGRKNFVGVLRGTKDTKVLIEIDNKIIEIDVESIEKAYLDMPPGEILQQDLHRKATSLGG
ncbi:MAG: ribosome maturation factor RimP [Desulfomonilaceae bacterium]